MKILIVDGTRTFGGAFELALTLQRFLPENDNAEVCVVSAQPKSVLQKRMPPGSKWHHLDRGVRYRVFDAPRYKSPFMMTSNLSKEFRAALRLARIAQSEKADILFLNNLLNDQPYGIMAARLAGIPCVCGHRDYEYNSKLTRWLERMVTHHIACSRLVERNLQELGASAEKISFVWDGVDLEKFTPAGPLADLTGLFGIPAGSKVFSIFGRLIDWKGHDIFIKAAAQVLKEVPDAHALIVGGVSDGASDWETYLKELAASLGIAGRITFAGFRSEVAALMRSSYLLVHASVRPEPFGTALLEGMACGRPYVAMNEGGPAEMIEEGVSGYLVPPSAPAAMAAAIVKLLQSPGLAQGMGQAARERVVQHFSAQKFAAWHYKVFEKVLSARAS